MSANVDEGMWESERRRRCGLLLLDAIEGTETGRRGGGVSGGVRVLFSTETKCNGERRRVSFRGVEGRRQDATEVNVSRTIFGLRATMDNTMYPLSVGVLFSLLYFEAAAVARLRVA